MRRGETLPTSEELQNRILTYIRAYVWEHDDPPTVAEIARAVGRAPSTIHRQIQIMTAAGLLTRSGRPQRGYQPAN